MRERHRKAPIPKPSRVLVTVGQMAKQQPALTVGSIRWSLFNRERNGLEESGAVIRNGRNIYLDQERYLEWLASNRYEK